MLEPLSRGEPKEATSAPLKPSVSDVEALSCRQDGPEGHCRPVAVPVLRLDIVDDGIAGW